MEKAVKQPRINVTQHLALIGMSLYSDVTEDIKTLTNKRFPLVPFLSGLNSSKHHFAKQQPSVGQHNAGGEKGKKRERERAG